VNKEYLFVKPFKANGSKEINISKFLSKEKIYQIHLSVAFEEFKSPTYNYLSKLIHKYIKS